jgi:hypothetical protein
MWIFTGRQVVKYKYERRREKEEEEEEEEEEGERGLLPKGTWRDFQVMKG